MVIIFEERARLLRFIWHVAKIPRTQVAASTRGPPSDVQALWTSRHLVVIKNEMLEVLGVDKIKEVIE